MMSMPISGSRPSADSLRWRRDEPPSLVAVGDAPQSPRPRSRRKAADTHGARLFVVSKIYPHVGLVRLVAVSSCGVDGNAAPALGTCSNPYRVVDHAPHCIGFLHPQLVFFNPGTSSTGRSDIGPKDCGHLNTLVRDPRSRLRVWHRRGWFSPSWLSHLSGWVAWAIPLAVSILPVFSLLAKPALREWLLAHPIVGIAGTAVGVGVLWFWRWAGSDASAREALRQIALHGRIAMPAGDLTPDDLEQDPRQVGPVSAFLPRRLRRFQDPDDSGSPMADVIPSLLLGESRHGRRVALIGAAAMGKTRLVLELISQLPPETIVFAPSRNLV